MKILIVTPAPPRTHYGNRVTALRWATILRSLGHRVTLAQCYENQACDLLIALHASRSYQSIREFHTQQPEKPLVVALTGTDLYCDLKTSRRAWQSLELASRLIVLQPQALDELPEHLQRKTRVIYQSVKSLSIRNPQSRLRNQFRVCVIGHLRAVKDPFRAALAARLLPASSRLSIIQIGEAMNETMKRRAERERQINPRYQWLGELPPARAQRILAGSDL